jgi:hypothetical protein
MPSLSKHIRFWKQYDTVLTILCTYTYTVGMICCFAPMINKLASEAEIFYDGSYFTVADIS